MSYTGPERRGPGRPKIGGRISVSLPDELRQFAKDIADRRGISESAVLRIVFARYAHSRRINSGTDESSPNL